MSPEPEDAVFSGMLSPKQTPSEGQMLATCAEARYANGHQPCMSVKVEDTHPAPTGPRPMSVYFLSSFRVYCVLLPKAIQMQESIRAFLIRGDGATS
jgi:hypothetical protein